MPACAAAHRAAARLMLTAGPPAVQQSIDISWPLGPQQQTYSSGVRRPHETEGQTDPTPCLHRFPQKTYTFYFLNNSVKN